MLEFGSLIAGPFATRLLGEFGAEVIKIEEPTRGDELRRWRYVHPKLGHSLWWALQSRNKKLITLNLKDARGLDIAKRLVQETDLVFENLRPGSLDALGLGWDVLHGLNPRLSLVRISGFGQDGPKAGTPSYGSVAEAVGGLRYVTGFPDRPPVRFGVSLGDTIGGLFAVIGALMALRAREMAGMEGQVVDVSMADAVLAMTESMLPEYSAAGIIRSRSGTRLDGISPSDTYKTADGDWLVIAGNGDQVFRRLMGAIGSPELADDPRLATNGGRVQNNEEVDAVIQAWVGTRRTAAVIEQLERAGVPVSRIYSVEDVANDEHFRARGMVGTAELDGAGEVLMPGVVPHLSQTPGGVRHYGGTLGFHNAEVLERLGMTAEEKRALQSDGVI